MQLDKIRCCLQVVRGAGGRKKLEVQLCRQGVPDYDLPAMNIEIRTLHIREDSFSSHRPATPSPEIRSIILQRLLRRPDGVIDGGAEIIDYLEQRGLRTRRSITGRIVYYRGFETVAYFDLRKVILDRLHKTDPAVFRGHDGSSLPMVVRSRNDVTQDQWLIEILDQM